MPIHPSPENRTLSPVAPLEQQNADLEFQNRDDREVEAFGGQGIGPSSEARMGVLNYVRIDKVNQDKSRGSCQGPFRRGGSNSMRAASGIANSSAMLFCPPVILW